LTGLLNVHEIFNFTQDDLDGSDVFILDALYTVYVWIGDSSDEKEKKMAFEVEI
jgi:hypothetical protein